MGRLRIRPHSVHAKSLFLHSSNLTNITNITNITNTNISMQCNASIELSPCLNITSIYHSSFDPATAIVL